MITEYQDKLRKISDLADAKRFTHNVAMKPEICEFIINSFDVKDKRILVMYNMEFVYTLIHKYDVKPDMITLYSDDTFKAKLLAKDNLRHISSFEENMKFDVILGNPPYEGKKELHQQFFNLAVDLLEDNGALAFIQPCTVYVNKKPQIRKHAAKMRENILKYYTSVRFVEGTVFKNAAIATKLSITCLTKTPSCDKVRQVEYSDGALYNNVELKNINQLGMDPTIYETLFNKISTYIGKNGSLHDITSSSEDELIYRLQQIRGHAGDKDFFTIISKDSSYVSNEGPFGIIIDDVSQNDNVTSYLKTDIARFALSLYKFNTNQHMGELKSIPKVSFKRSWTDEEVAKEFKITLSELQEIRKCIPEYY